MESNGGGGRHFQTTTRSCIWCWLFSFVGMGELVGKARRTLYGGVIPLYLIYSEVT